MHKVKVSELEGAALDWAVAKCEGFRCHIFHGDLVQIMVEPNSRSSYYFNPSENWSEGGPIIEREKITLSYRDRLMPTGNQGCVAYYLSELFEDNGGFHSIGSTPLIAAMRCYVASKLSDEIEVPEELLK